MNFVVENAGNTCYIDSLLMALFFEESIIERLLTTDVRSDQNAGTAMYLQEYIKLNFIDNIRAGLSVTADVMSMLRELLIENGWKKDLIDEHIEQQDVNEFFTFLIDVLNGPLMEIQRSTITEVEVEADNTDDVGPIEKIPFIPLSIPETNTESSLHIKDLLKTWMFENYSNVKRIINGREKTITALNSYHVVNIPYMVALGINRFKNDGIKDKTHIEIQRNILLHNNNNTTPLNNHSWTFHSVVCHKGSSLKQGHYYALLCKKIDKNNYKYYKFDDLATPSLEEVSMSDPDITSQLKTDCVFIIYKYTI
ncbi:MAG: ubiquitin carboxyl-terminal hydrolase [Homavirus sp.]|uniref:ubiquitinyl hydrolase 1 n=1 Tax=Homavirus sp. TaxID=2487769 RepID=A0A3G5A915_9VIRU|nr:MAG: ubiquitin carboxyl-terminal hydrolase [Homavirus sp.]